MGIATCPLTQPPTFFRSCLLPKYIQVIEYMKSAKTLDPAVLRRCSAALRTLSHPDRLRIVEVLEAGPQDVTELTAKLRRPQATVSQHLMRLRAHGLVAAERQGRSARYRVAHPGCLTILGCIRSHFSS